MKIGLFFGSFNPIHIGHLIVANTVLDLTGIEQVWFVISPQNPFKKKAGLLDELKRLVLVEQAIADNEHLLVSTVEFDMPKPSYTIDTLKVMDEKYPSDDFSIVMGEDNLMSLHKWKEFDNLINNYSIIVYPRLGYETDQYDENKRVHKVDVPIIGLSSTIIREKIKEGKSIQYLVHDKVYSYLLKEKWYQNDGLQ